MKVKNVFLALVSGALIFCGCEGNAGRENRPTSADLIVTVSTPFIRSNGVDVAQIDVLLDGVSVFDEATLFDADNNIVSLDGKNFSTTEPGIYTFWASYGSKYSADVQVTAIDAEIPQIPEDPQPDNLSFSRRLLLMQFTGTACGYCPNMITALRELAQDEDYASKYAHVAVHSYNSSDPAFSEDGENIDAQFGISQGLGYPACCVDFRTFVQNANPTANLSMLKAAIDDNWSRTAAKAGLSVSTSTDGVSVVALVQVKAAETAAFRVGAWLLESGIYGAQTNYSSSILTGDYNTHDNCLRVADSRVSRTNYTGHLLGEIQTGAVGSYSFVIPVESDWDLDNCHLVVFVTAEEGTTWYVNNVTTCPMNDSVTYLYTE